MKKCFIRLDASPSLGFGHLMRCLALSDELKSSFEVIFVVRENESKTELEKYSFDIIQITANSNEEDSMLLLAVNNPNSIWIIDTKRKFLEKFLPSLKKNSDVVLLIENLSKNIDHVDGILFPAAHLDYNILDPWLPKSKRDMVLTGWDWILLRNEIINASRSDSYFPLVITTGGTDPSGVFFKIWELLEGAQIHATFMIGDSFANRNKLPLPDEFLKIVDYDIKYIASAGTIISTFGISVAECLFLNKPVISVAHSKENARGSEILSTRTPACINLGYFKDLTRERLIKEIDELKHPNEEINSWLSQNVIDGQGAKRVVSWIKRKVEEC